MIVKTGEKQMTFEMEEETTVKRWGEIVIIAFKQFIAFLCIIFCAISVKFIIFFIL